MKFSFRSGMDLIPFSIEVIWKRKPALLIAKQSVLPSRSAFSDFSLIADLFGKNVPKLVFFLPEKSAFWPNQCKKSDFHSISLPHKAKIYSAISLNMEYFQIKFDWVNF